jgi:hypothetical protein
MHLSKTGAADLPGYAVLTLSALPFLDNPTENGLRQNEWYRGCLAVALIADACKLPALTSRAVIRCIGVSGP